MLTPTRFISGEGTPAERRLFEHAVICPGCTPDGRTLCWEGRALALAAEEEERRAVRLDQVRRAVRRARGRA